MTSSALAPMRTPYKWNAELTQSAIYIYQEKDRPKIRLEKILLCTDATSTIFSPFSGAFYAVSAIAVLAYKYILFGKLWALVQETFF